MKTSAVSILFTISILIPLSILAINLDHLLPGEDGEVNTLAVISTCSIVVFGLLCFFLLFTEPVIFVVSFVTPSVYSPKLIKTKVLLIILATTVVILKGLFRNIYIYGSNT